VSVSTSYPNGQTLVSSAFTPKALMGVFQALTASSLGLDAGTLIYATLNPPSAIVQVASAAGLAPTNAVSGPGIAPGTTINAISGNNVTLSNPVTENGTNVPLQIGAISSAFTTEDNNPAAVLLEWQQTGQPAFGIDQNACYVRAALVDDPYTRIRDKVLTSNGWQGVLETDGYTRAWEVTWNIYGPSCFDWARQIKDALFTDWHRFQLAGSNLYLVTDVGNPRYAPEVAYDQWWQRVDFSARFYEWVINQIVIAAGRSVQVGIYDAAGLAAEARAATWPCLASAVWIGEIADASVRRVLLDCSAQPQPSLSIPEIANISVEELELAGVWI
jgi:hypothetical protein